jgi:hypothetical protein
MQSAQEILWRIYSNPENLVSSGFPTNKKIYARQEKIPPSGGIFL